MGDEQRVEAFAPGRVNLIGEHTDYNDGLALPFAIERGVTVVATPSAGDEIHALALDLGEEDRFAVGVSPPRAADWRAFVRGVVAELRVEGVPVGAMRLEIGGDLPRGAGLSSSAALTVALTLALSAAAGVRRPGRVPGAPGDVAAAGWDDVRIARLCARVENDWVGARTGLLDQLASLGGRAGHALRIDFRDLAVTPVPLALGDWSLVVVDSGDAHVHAGSGYNERRAECAEACELLGVASLRDARDVGGLPDPLRRRVRHVLDENERIDRAVAALRAGDLAAVGCLLDASHASLRDLYEASTPAVERTVAALRAAGAAGARMIGGGFGGHVLGLLPPGVVAPDGALAVTPSAGARIFSET